MTEPDIEALLRQDEEALREKRKRLKAFAASMTEVRQANKKASKLVAELLDNGDVTKADLVKVLGLSAGERSALVPATKRTSVADATGDGTDAVAGSEA